MATTSSATTTGTGAVKWAIALGGTWFVLTMLTDIGGLEELSVAIALLILTGVALTQGAGAIQHLGF